MNHQHRIEFIDEVSQAVKQLRGTEESEPGRESIAIDKILRNLRAILGVDKLLVLRTAAIDDAFGRLDPKN